MKEEQNCTCKVDGIPCLPEGSGRPYPNRIGLLFAKGKDGTVADVVVSFSGGELTEEMLKKYYVDNTISATDDIANIYDNKKNLNVDCGNSDVYMLSNGAVLIIAPFEGKGVDVRLPKIPAKPFKFNTDDLSTRLDISMEPRKPSKSLFRRPGVER